MFIQIIGEGCSFILSSYKYDIYDLSPFPSCLFLVKRSVYWLNFRRTWLFRIQAKCTVVTVERKANIAFRLFSVL